MGALTGEGLQTTGVSVKEYGTHSEKKGLKKEFNVGLAVFHGSRNEVEDYFKQLVGHSTHLGWL